MSDPDGASPNTIHASGVDGLSGRLLYPAVAAETFAGLVAPEGVANVAGRGGPLPPFTFDTSRPRPLSLAAWIDQLAFQPTAGRNPGDGFGRPIDLDDLADAGWAVLVTPDLDPAIREALAPLLTWRAAQAGERYREVVVQPGESMDALLERLDLNPGQLDPTRLPYYLLIVGDPEAIPFAFQYELSHRYAVGRLDLEHPDAFAAYVDQVLRAERDGDRGRSATAPDLAFFAAANADDAFAPDAAELLVRPLFEGASATWPEQRISATIGNGATKDRLAALLGGDDTPRLCFVSCHGIGFPDGHPRQREAQGALVTQDWPGPVQHAGPLLPEQYWSAEDVGKDRDLGGTIAFLLCCHGAGVPQWDDFAHRIGKVRRAIAPAPFTSRLPQRLLGHPCGSALAVLSHVERVWSTSFLWQDEVDPNRQVFEIALRRLLEGRRVGEAMEIFRDHANALASLLANKTRIRDPGRRSRADLVARLWTGAEDARNYVILGDPAVRMVGAPFSG